MFLKVDESDESDDSSSDLSDVPGTTSSRTPDVTTVTDPLTTTTAPSCSSENITAVSADASSDDEPDDEEVQHACQKAEEVYEFVELGLPHNICHCKCQLNNGSRCIDQFRLKIKMRSK